MWNRTAAFVLLALAWLLAGTSFASIPGATSITPGTKTAIWVFAHSDDETLAAAGAIHEHEEAGIRNIVIIVASGADSKACGKRGLDEAQCLAARRYEGRIAIASLGVDPHDMHHLGWAGWNSSELVAWLDEFIMGELALSPAQVSLKGHSPADYYETYGRGGHNEHREVSKALVQMNTRAQNRFGDVRYYRIGHLYGDFTCGQGGNGRASVLTPHGHALKLVAMSEYQQYAPTAGRHAIGGLSVPTLWVRVQDPATPECWERPEDLPRRPLAGPAR